MRIIRQVQPKRPVENVISMINVVFLLLVFFLITARITPPLPVEINPPEAKGAPFDGGADDLVFSQDGVVYYAGHSGEAVWPILAERKDGEPLTLRVDRAAPGALLARTLARINAGAGVTVNLVAEN